MAISRTKQIKRIFKDADVRDPRATLEAIEKVLAQPKPESTSAKPIATIRVFDAPQSNQPLQSLVEIEFSRRATEPRHLKAAMIATQQLGDKLFGDDAQCDDPNCPVHGINKPQATTDLIELFKQFEEDARKATGIKNKGDLQ